MNRNEDALLTLFWVALFSSGVVKSAIRPRDRYTVPGAKGPRWREATAGPLCWQNKHLDGGWMKAVLKRDMKSEIITFRSKFTNRHSFLWVNRDV